jgi:hypothetical protein
MALSLIRHLVLSGTGVATRFLGTGGFDSAASDHGFAFFNQQGATSRMDLASRFARPKKPARMILPVLNDGQDQKNAN